MLRAKLESIDSQATIAGNADVIGLLKHIKSATFSFQSQKHEPHTLHEAKRRFYQTNQHKNAICQSYLESFQNSIEVLEYSGGDIWNNIGLVERALASKDLTMKTVSKEEIVISKNFARDA